VSCSISYHDIIHIDTKVYIHIYVIRKRTLLKYRQLTKTVFPILMQIIITLLINKLQTTDWARVIYRNLNLGGGIDKCLGV